MILSLDKSINLIIISDFYKKQCDQNNKNFLNSK